MKNIHSLPKDVLIYKILPELQEPLLKRIKHLENVIKQSPDSFCCVRSDNGICDKNIYGEWCCNNCELKVCDHHSIECGTCGKIVCSKCVSSCSECIQEICEVCYVMCSECEAHGCVDCTTELCANCKVNFCKCQFSQDNKFICKKCCKKNLS